MENSHNLNRVDRPVTFNASLSDSVEADAKVRLCSDPYERIIGILQNTQPDERTLVLRRVVKWHNNSNIMPENRIEINQAHIDKSFENKYPKLNDYINQLNDVLSPENLASFAFVTGQFSLYHDIVGSQEKTNSQDNKTISFLQNFFEMQGSTHGIAQVNKYLINNALLYQYQINDLLDFHNKSDVEDIPARTGFTTSADNVNYLAMYTQIVTKLTDDETKQLCRQLKVDTHQKSDSYQENTIKLMARLSDHFENHRTEIQLINAIKKGTNNVLIARDYKSQLEKDASNR